MHKIDRNSLLWKYLTSDLKGLIEDGEQLVVHAIHHEGEKTSDYSYTVFSFAKAYEGFLKKMFLDLDLIKEDEYYGDDIRIGRILNPHFVKENENVFSKICDSQGNNSDLAIDMWKAWRRGRNQVFHYFPHNFRRLEYKEALDIVDTVINVMERAVVGCRLSKPMAE